MFGQRPGNEELHGTEALRDELQFLVAADACVSLVQVLQDARGQRVDVRSGDLAVRVAEDRLQCLNALDAYLEVSWKV